MRKLFCLLGLLLLLMSGIPALADSISPSSFTATLAPGGSVTISKTVTITAGTPTSSKVDVFFLADTTGSMGSYIGAVKTSASTILSTVAGLGDVAFGVGEYKDFVGDPYAYRLNTAMTTTQATAQAGINMWSASGGGDAPEAQLYAINRLTTDAATGWRTGSSRILVWMGDYPGHDPSSGITEGAATAALVAAGIETYPISVGANQLNQYGQAARIASATGGTYYSGISTANIVATITSAITTAFDTYSTVGLDLSEVPAGVNASAVPGSYTGSFDRSVERTFAFDVTFTGVTEGVYGFNIYATLNGGRVATESDRITVTAIPEPGSIVLLGTVMLGVATVVRRRRRLV